LCLLFSGKTALHGSSLKGNMEVCKLLIECQADVNAKDRGCDARPLHMLLQTKAVLRFCFERCNSCVFFSVERLHCMSLYWDVTSRFASCWSNVKLTSMRKTEGATPVPYTCFCKRRRFCGFVLSVVTLVSSFQWKDRTAWVFLLRSRGALQAADRVSS
jgi:hypothetical protein